MVVAPLRVTLYHLFVLCSSASRQGGLLSFLLESQWINLIPQFPRCKKQTVIQTDASLSEARHTEYGRLGKGRAFPSDCATPPLMVWFSGAHFDLFYIKLLYVHSHKMFLIELYSKCKKYQ